LLHHKFGLFDLLNGSTTLNCYILKRWHIFSQDEKNAFIDNFIEIVAQTSIAASAPYKGIFWKTFALFDSTWKINLGISHGIPALTMFF